MATYFKGVAPGTHYAANDPGDRWRGGAGFNGDQQLPHSADAVIRHIARYSWPSPYVSISHSFAVARAYAVGGGDASSTNPGRVFEIDIFDEKSIIHPVQELSILCSAGKHFHDGDQQFIHAIAAPSLFPGLLISPPHRSGPSLSPPSMDETLQALVWSLRDAEALVRQLSANCVMQIHKVW